MVERTRFIAGRCVIPAVVAALMLAWATCAGAVVQHITNFGTRGSGEVQFYLPYGVALSDSHVYVADTYNNRIQKYTLSGGFLAASSVSDPSAGSYNRPGDVDVTPGGKLVVADSRFPRVQVLHDNLSLLTKFGSGADFGIASGVATDAAGNIFVVDSDRNAVSKFAADGSFLFSFGSGLNGPSDVVVGGGGDIYVSNTLNGAIQRYDAAGTLMETIGAPGSGALGLFYNPRGLALDAYGHLFIADSNNHRIQRYDPVTGTFTSFGSGSGAGATQFNRPYDVAVDTLGNVVVADAYNHRISVWYDPDAVAAVQVVVPEPVTALLSFGALGGAALLALRRRAV